MPDRLSALAAAYKVGRHGNPAAEPAVSLREVPALAMVQVSWSPAGEAAVGEALAGVAGTPVTVPEAGRAVEAGALTVLWSGPRRILAVGADAGLPAALDAAFATVQGAAAVDLSQARTVVRVEGPGLRPLLSKGAPVDLHPGVAPVGSAISTRFNHFAVLLHLRAADQADVYVTRSFAQSFWWELTDLAAEQGYEVASAG